VIDRLAILLPIAGCMVFGAIVFIELEPSSLNDPAIIEAAPRSDVAPAVHRRQSPRPDELLATILARPLFSSTRRPAEGPANTAATSDLADTRLTGIVTEPGRHIAIFAVNGAKPLILSEGESVSGWRIENITPRDVSLSGPEGTKTLQPKVDPNLAPPAGQNPPGNAAVRPPVPPAAPAGARSPIPAAPVAAGHPGPALPTNAPGMLPRPARQRPQR
jgi:hypothetical protein